MSKKYLYLKPNQRLEILEDNRLETILFVNDISRRGNLTLHKHRVGNLYIRVGWERRIHPRVTLHNHGCKHTGRRTHISLEMPASYIYARYDLPTGNQRV